MYLYCCILLRKFIPAPTIVIRLDLLGACDVIRQDSCLGSNLKD